ncbi:hypothetical protein [Flaviaesturariibacter aridisoli]|uniref:Uncharacterized protein n=1 Tax=Flaviaesturariibacter aridisoli TaxID=2545761 RepID=A0A4R4E0M4_9BACT|nr:hypothetical protein [Flaviaesturariibacter aridisoli]TCZ67710.1 hypothetical protein E0486_15225 [Flaviaesturariibacter aridisoli]
MPSGLAGRHVRCGVQKAANLNTLIASNVDHTKLVHLDLDTLKDMYASAASKLKEALLNGTEWNTLQEYRYDVTELEIALHKKIRMGGGLGPAENENRASAEPELH